MAKNIEAFMQAFRLLYRIIHQATQSPNGYCWDGAITFVMPFVNTLILGSWFIRLSTRRIHNNRFYVRFEVANLDSEAAAALARVRL
jgi:hypothetical protein